MNQSVEPPIGSEYPASSFSRRRRVFGAFFRICSRQTAATKVAGGAFVQGFGVTLT